VPARPVVDELRSGIVLLAQPQQTDVPRMTRREARHLNIVAQQVRRCGERVDLAFEVALLVIPARAPAQTAADVEVLAQDVPHHVLGSDALGRALVVRAAGGMNVMVARPPALLRRMHPALQLEALGMRLRLRHRDVPGEDEVLRAAGVVDGVLARLQQNGFAVAAVDLGVEKEDGGEAATLRRVDAGPVVAEGEGPQGRLAVVIADTQFHEYRRATLEEIDDLVAPSNALLRRGGRPLVCVAPEAEAEVRLAPASVAAVDLKDAIFQLEA